MYGFFKVCNLKLQLTSNDITAGNGCHSKNDSRCEEAVNTYSTSMHLQHQTVRGQFSVWKTDTANPIYCETKIWVPKSTSIIKAQ